MTERPESPLSRIAPAPFNYCLDCHCDHCRRVFSSTFCPACGCQTCSRSVQDIAYAPERDDSPSALGKRKQKSLMISPVKRVKADSIKTAIKKFVQEAAISAASGSSFEVVPPNVGRFCLISLGHSSEDCLETCHIVPRALDEDKFQKLEFAWGLRYYGLYLHSRYNLTTLTSGLHASFDKGLWALVPMDHQYLLKFDEFFDKEGKWRKKPRDNDRMKGFYNGARHFQYTLLALPHDYGLRKPLIRSWTAVTSANELESRSHFFPYGTLPVIHSHIQPHFVIYNLGAKLCSLDFLLSDNRYRPLISQHPSFITCVKLSWDLYNEWTREQPPGDFSGPYSPRDQMETGVDSTNNLDATYSRNAPKRSTRGGQSAGESGGGDELGTVNDDVEIYPDDSLTLVFEAAAEQDDTNEPSDDEHTDDESDESFYARLSTWITSVRSEPGSPTTLFAHSIPESKTPTKSDSDTDGSATFVDRQTCREFSTEGEKIRVMSPISFITPGPV